jgi:hypothetical protein|tara:strand:- start:6110 stop:6634 length:525 start_codon:yes stop_codon:yes gene_type:complete
MNKKAQFDNPLILFAVLVIGLLIIAPIMLKVMREIQTPFSDSLGNMSGGGIVGQTNFNAVIQTGINFWDKVVIAAFIFAVMMLFVSSFLVDAHPFFIILYIFMSFMLILFAPNIITAVDQIYDSASFAEETAMLTFMDTLRTYYAEFLVAMMFVTGIIIYGKLFLLNRSAGARR